MRCTIADVERAFEVLRNDPEKFALSPRLQWIVATFWKLVDESERERAARRKSQKQKAPADTGAGFEDSETSKG
jgi:hypothetical protein